MSSIRVSAAALLLAGSVAHATEFERAVPLSLAAARTAAECVVVASIKEFSFISMEGVIATIAIEHVVSCSGSPPKEVALLVPPTTSGPFMFFVETSSEGIGRLVFEPEAGSEWVSVQMDVLEKLDQLRLGELIESEYSIAREAALDYLAVAGGDGCETHVWNSLALARSDFERSLVLRAGTRCLDESQLFELGAQSLATSVEFPGDYVALDVMSRHPTLGILALVDAINCSSSARRSAAYLLSSAHDSGPALREALLAAVARETDPVAIRYLARALRSVGEREGLEQLQAQHPQLELAAELAIDDASSQAPEAVERLRDLLLQEGNAPLHEIAWDGLRARILLGGPAAEEATEFALGRPLEADALARRAQVQAIAATPTRTLKLDLLQEAAMASGDEYYVSAVEATVGLMLDCAPESELLVREIQMHAPHEPQRTMALKVLAAWAEMGSRECQ